MEKALGKIKDAYVGLGGYQDAMIGIHFTFEGDGFGVSSTKSIWDPNIIKCSEYSKWSEPDRDKAFSEIMRYISDLLKQAKVDSVSELKNKPVEITFENSTLKEWRILTEVL